MKTPLWQAIKQSSYEHAPWRKGCSHIAGPESPMTQKTQGLANCLLRPSIPVCRVLAVGKKHCDKQYLFKFKEFSMLCIHVSELPVGAAGVLTGPMTSWRCLQQGRNQTFDVSESLEVRVWVCTNLPDAENMTFTSVSLTTAAVEDAVKGPFAQATDIKKRGRKWLRHHTFSTVAKPRLDVVLVNQLYWFVVEGKGERAHRPMELLVA